MRCSALVLAVLLATGVTLATAPRAVVLCAPGYPGDTLQAQPTMDAFAARLAAAAKLPAGSLVAAYHETDAGGVARLGENDAVLAIVTLPFYLAHGAALGLTPRAQAALAAGATDTWSLVARKGAVTGAASLAGWEVVGGPGYAPDVVRGPILGAWGTLPADTKVTFSAAVLTWLRRAAQGQKVAVLVDREGAERLAGLPFAKDLEVVTKSAEWPVAVVCTIGSRITDAQAQPLVAALLALDKSPEGAEVLKGMRMQRFAPLDAPALEKARRAMPAAK